MPACCQVGARRADDFRQQMAAETAAVAARLAASLDWLDHKSALAANVVADAAARRRAAALS